MLFPGLLRGYCANLRVCRDSAAYLRACATHKSIWDELACVYVGALP